MDQYYTAFETELGWVALLGRDGKVLETTLPKTSREQAIRDLAGISTDTVEDSQRFGNLPERIKSYFKGESADLACEIDFTGISPFELCVYQELMKLPRGTVISYGELAIAAGKPGAARAVGNAMRKNPVPVMVPCHRVVHSDGSIGGFGGGTDMKRRMLQIEGVEI